MSPSWSGDRCKRLEAALAEAVSLVRVRCPWCRATSGSLKQKGGDDAIDLGDKAFRQLGRIELTYDRVFAAYGSSEPPHAQKARINLTQLIEYLAGAA